MSPYMELNTKSNYMYTTIKLCTVFDLDWPWPAACYWEWRSKVMSRSQSFGLRWLYCIGMAPSAMVLCLY